MRELLKRSAAEAGGPDAAAAGTPAARARADSDQSGVGDLDVGDGGSGRGAGPGRRVLRERLSPASGWFYEVGRTIYKGATSFQDIELVETEEFGTTLLLDGAVQVMEKSEFQYHEPLAHIPLLAHPEPRRVLIIGGGDGGLLRETLKHRCVETVDFVELDEEVVSFSRTHLKALNGGAFDDPRVRTFFADGRAFVEAVADGSNPGERAGGAGGRAPGERAGAIGGGYDVILMDMTDPAGPSLMLYTREFFGAIRRALRDERALFAMHSESPETRPEAFSRIRRTLAAVFPTVRGAYAFIRMYGTLWSFAVAGDETDPRALSPDEAGRRLADRGVGPLKLVSGDTWTALLAPWPYIEELALRPGPVSTDEAPEFPDAFDPRL